LRRGSEGPSRKSTELKTDDAKSLYLSEAPSSPRARKGLSDIFKRVARAVFFDPSFHAAIEPNVRRPRPSRLSEKTAPVKEDPPETKLSTTELCKKPIAGENGSEKSYSVQPLTIRGSPAGLFPSTCTYIN
jgi:hypothetical protein